MDFTKIVTGKSDRVTCLVIVEVSHPKDKPHEYHNFDYLRLNAKEDAAFVVYCFKVSAAYNDKS